MTLGGPRLILVGMADAPQARISDGDTTETGDKTEVLHGDPSTLHAELLKAKEQQACLIIIRGTPQGYRFFLTQDEMVLGREPDTDICVADQGVSRRHAQLNRSNQGVSFTDLGSSNGSFINDVPVPAHQPMKLAKEDMIKVGTSILKFLPAGELEILFYGALGSAAHTDPLTGIYNKGYLLEVLEAEFKRAKALHSQLSLIFFDLDHFKKVNDQYGHEAGDYVLKELCSLIRGNLLRPKDVFARYGGEEFIIILPNSEGARALTLAEEIRLAIQSHHFTYESQRLPVTASLGTAEFLGGMEAARTLLVAADRALYAAKAGGRNQVIAAQAH